MLIPGPDTRVVELRVHGILGTTAEELLDTVSAVDVGGDGVGRIVRPADRLHRPAPGPVLRADGRPLPRTLEGYVWGAMTSGGWSKAIWALLFPFTLANVASWMLPPVPPDNRLAEALAVGCRALSRLAALLLTLLLVTQVAAVSIDLLAAQCLAPGGRCLAPVVPDWVRTMAGVRPAVGVVPVLLLVLVLLKVARVNWSANASHPTPNRLDPAGGAPGGRLGRLPGTIRVADPDAPALRTLHLSAALATTAVLALGGPGGPDGNVWVWLSWTTAVVLVVLCVAGVLVLGDPTGARDHNPGGWLGSVLAPVPRRIVAGVAVLVVASVVPERPHLSAPVTGAGPTLGVVGFALGGACVALGILLVPAAVLARPAWATLPRELRPWAGGWMAAPFMTLAGLLGGGFGAGVAIAVRQALGGLPLALPHGYAYLTVLWGIAGVLAMVAVLAVGTVEAVRRLAMGSRIPPEAALLHAGDPAGATAATGSWRLAAWGHRHAHHVVLGLTGVLAIGALGSLVPLQSGALPAVGVQPLSALGLAALTFLALALLREVYTAARNPQAARQLGGLSDLACFWPREAHPIVPPCYALKAVPELAARAADYLAEPNTRVVLTGHSQGSLLAAAAATRLLAGLPDADRARVGLLTYGSPMQFAYPRAFPAIVPHDGLLELYRAMGGRWRTLARGTDPIGGGLTTWRRQVFDGKLIGVGFRDDGTEGALPPAVPTATGALVLGGDHWLPDPQFGPVRGRRWSPGVLGHNDYFSDPEWDRAVACAAGMETPGSSLHPGVDPGVVIRADGTHPRIDVSGTARF